jgi:hypothetical protein
MVTTEVERDRFLFGYALRLRKQLSIDCVFCEVRVEAEKVVECCA